MTSKFSIDNRELLQRISSGEAVVGIDFGNLIVRELAAFRLAAMDSESECLPLDYLQGRKDGLEWAAKLAEANHHETGDWLYDDPIELAKAIRKGPDMPPAQPVADSEPVAEITEDLGRLFVKIHYPTTLRVGDKLYLHAQTSTAGEPVLWAWQNLDMWHVTSHHGRARDLGLSGFKVIPLYRHAQQPVVPENCVTAEHRRVIEMLLSVCGAAFELADDSCQQDVDGEDCHVVPDDAFQKLSDALDEIENTLPTEDIDRPDVFLAWSAMPRAALKSLLQAQPAPDYFASLVAAARVRADKAISKFPQPNYVLNKVAEESGEVIKAVIHYTEGREEWSNVEAEIIDNLAMLLRLVKEGDQVIGFTPPVSCRAAMLNGGKP